MTAFPLVTPPPDGLRLAFVAARRRRTRTAAASGAAGLLATVLLLATLGGGGGQRTLLQEPLPPAHGGALPGIGLPPPSPQAQPRQADRPAGEARAPLAPRRAPAASAHDRGARVEQPGVPGAGTAAPRPAGVGAAAVSGPMSRGEMLGYGNNDVVCPARKKQQGSRGLCVEVTSHASSSGGVTLQANICNTDAADATLTYPTARELDVAITRQGDDLWRWSVGRSFPATPHRVSLPVGECLVWSTDWAGVDQQGHPLAKGTYRVVADFDAEELSEPDRHSNASVTVS